MQIQYRNTLDHLVALQKYVLRHTDFGKKMMLHRFLAVEAIIVFITIFFAVNHNRFIVLMSFVIVSGLAWLFRERSVLLQFRKDFKRERRRDDQGLFDEDRIMRIAPGGLTVEVGTQHTHHHWSKVEMTGRDRRYVYIILTGVLHYIIPVSAFSNDTEVGNFLDAIEDYRSRT